jgi:hypothetical protein
MHSYDLTSNPVTEIQSFISLIEENFASLIL